MAYTGLGLSSYDGRDVGYAFIVSRAGFRQSP
jgi:hypothetical protein